MLVAIKDDARVPVGTLADVHKMKRKAPHPTAEVPLTLVSAITRAVSHYVCDNPHGIVPLIDAVDVAPFRGEYGGKILQEVLRQSVIAEVANLVTAGSHSNVSGELDRAASVIVALKKKPDIFGDMAHHIHDIAAGFVDHGKKTGLSAQYAMTAAKFIDAVDCNSHIVDGLIAKVDAWLAADHHGFGPSRAKGEHAHHKAHVHRLPAPSQH